MHDGVRGMRRLAMTLALAASLGCARKPPQEIAAANAAVERARAACAAQFAPAALGEATAALGDLNALAEARRFGKASKAAPGVVALADQAASTAAAARDQTRAEAAAATQRAEAAIGEAVRAEADSRAGGDLAAARARLEESKRLAASPCNAPQSRDAALAAAELAGTAREKAIAVAREEEEAARRLAEVERRRRLEEEAARHSEEPPPLPESYTVAPGDTLWQIARGASQYGDAFQWPLIFKANRSQIKDPDLIYPRQTLKIPRDVPPGEVDDAAREARRRKPGDSPSQPGQ